MKKILIIIVAFIVALAPVVGNYIIESKLDENIKNLSLNGLEIKKQDSKSGYLNTSRHYEFIVKDSKEFREYLSAVSNKQVSPYADLFFKDSVIGVDLEYSNVPVLRSTSIDIYPVSLSEETMDKIEKENSSFAEFVKQFLEEKSLMYHVDYDIVTKNFEGYIKDIKETYSQDTNQKMEFELSDSTFTGNGNLISPKFLTSQTKKMRVYFEDSMDKFDFNFEDLLVSSSFESTTSYSSNIDLKSMNIDMKGKYQKDSNINIEGLNFGFASSTDGKKAKFFSKSSFEKLYIDAKKESLYIKKFNFDSTLNNIDKDSYEELNNLLRSGANFDSSSVNYKMQKLVQEMFLRGFTLDIKDISVENIRVDDKKDLGTSFVKANIKLPKNIVKNTINPTELADNIGIDMLIDISKPMFEILIRTTPVLALSQSFAKDQGSSLVFDVKVKDGSIIVNDKKVR